MRLVDHAMAPHRAGAQPAFSSQIKAANRSVIGTVSASRHRKASHFLDWDTEAVQDFSIQTRRVLRLGDACVPYAQCSRRRLRSNPPGPFLILGHPLRHSKTKRASASRHAAPQPLSGDRKKTAPPPSE
jgi:hypothetical protein